MWIARHEISKSNEVLTTPVKLAWLYSALFFCPAAGWSFYAYKGWATVYLRPEGMIPAWAGPAIFTTYFIGMVFGTLIAQFLIQKKEMKLFWSVFGLGLFWLAVVTILTIDEYQVVGTYAAYQAGRAVPIQEVPEFMAAMNIMGAVMAIPGVALAALLWKRGKNYQANQVAT